MRRFLESLLEREREREMASEYKFLFKTPWPLFGGKFWALATAETKVKQPNFVLHGFPLHK